MKAKESNSAYPSFQTAESLSTLECRVDAITTAMRLAKEIGGDVTWRDVIPPEFFLPSSLSDLLAGERRGEHSGNVDIKVQMISSGATMISVESISGGQNSIGKNDVSGGMNVHNTP